MDREQTLLDIVMKSDLARLFPAIASALAAGEAAVAKERAQCLSATKANIHQFTVVNERKNEA